MKVTIQAMNKMITKGNWNTFESGLYEVEPYMISRSSCGSGSAANRFYYTAHYIGEKDMIDIFGNSAVGVKCTGNIDRKLDKQFKPKNLEFNDNKCIFNKAPN